MKRNLVVLCALFVSLWLAGNSAFAQQSVTEGFDGSGALSSNWIADAELVRVGGVLHNNLELTWRRAVYKSTFDVQRVALRWATTATAAGVEKGGIIFVDAQSLTANGYFIYFREGKYHLYRFENGMYGSKIVAIPGTAPGPDSRVQVDYADNEFTVSVDGTETAVLPIGGSPEWALKYGGVYIYGNVGNDINAMAFENLGGGTIDPPPPPPPDGEYKPETDDFSTFNAANWSLDPLQSVTGGEMTVTGTPTNGWGHLATYKGQGSNGVEVVLSSTNYQNYDNSVVLVAPAFLLDSFSSEANGYAVRREASTAQVYLITGGTMGNAIGSAAAVSQPMPTAGSTLKVVIADNGGTKTVQLFIDGNLDATMTFSESRALETSYCGFVQYSSPTNTSYRGVSNVTSFTGWIYSIGGEPAALNVIAGNNQSGPIRTTLPDTVKIRVVDEDQKPVPGVTVDFAITEPVDHDHVLSVDQFSWDGLLWIEAEDAQLLNRTFTDDDPLASGGYFVTTPNESYQRGNIMVRIPFYIPTAGTDFVIWGRFIAPGGGQNTLEFTADDDAATYKKTDLPIGTAWDWEYISPRLSFTKGSHFIDLIIYDPGWSLDKVMIVNRTLAGNYDPSGSGMGGSGPVFPNITNDDGVVFTKVSFGNKAGNVVLEATTTNSEGGLIGPAIVNLTATPGPAQRLLPEATSITMPGFLLSTTTLQVQAVDEYGNGVSNVSVSWQLIRGSGATLSSQTSFSNSAGYATVDLTLGVSDTEYEVRATAAGLTGSPKTFLVQVSRVPDSMVKIGGDNQSGQAGEPLTEPVVVRLLEANGTTGFENFPVKFKVTRGGGFFRSMDGSREGADININTDSDGYARATWVLGEAVGPNEAQVTAPGVSLAKGGTQTFYADGLLGPASRFAIFSGDGQTGYAGVPVENPLVSIVTDQHGNPIQGYNVNYSIATGTNAYLGSNPGTRNLAVQTDLQGKAAVNLTMGTEIAQTHIIRARATGLTPDSLTFRIYSSNEVIAKRLEYISGRGQAGEVTQPLAQPFRVRVMSAITDIPVEGHPVYFKVMKGGGNLAGSGETVVFSDITGYAEATLTMGHVAGTDSQVVDVRSYFINSTTQQLDNSPIRFTASATPGPASAMIKFPASDNQTANVGQQLPVPIKVKVTDIHGNAISNHSVIFEVKGAGGTLVDQQGENTFKTIRSGSDGYAVVSWKMPLTPGVWQLDAISYDGSGMPLTNSPINFRATSIPDNASLMVALDGADQDTLVGVVNQPLSQPIRIKVTDKYNNPVPNYPIVFQIGQGAGKVNGLSMVTLQTAAETGIVAAEWVLGTVAGRANNILEARSGIAGGSLIVFKASALPDVANRMIDDKTSNQQSGKVGQPLAYPIRVQIVDQFGNGVPDFAVTFAVLGEDTTRGNIDGLPEALVTTAADGFAQVNWTLGSVPGSRNNSMRVSAKLNSVHLINSPYVFYASATRGDAYRLTRMTTIDQVGNIGSAYVKELKVKVTDEFYNPVAGHPVRFRVTNAVEAQGGSLDLTSETQITKNTDSNGLVGVIFTLGDRAGVEINRLLCESEFSGVPLQGSPVEYRISAQATNAHSIQQGAGNSQNGTVGQFLPNQLEVRVLDEYGNLVMQPQAVQFRIIAGQGFLGNDSARTLTINSVNGLATLKWRMGTVAGTNNNVVEATAQNGPRNLGTVRFTASAKADITDAQQSTVRAFPANAVKVSEGSVVSNIVVTLRDRFGNLIPDKAVILKQPMGQNLIINNPTSLTDVNGQVSGSVASTRAGEKVIWAYDMNNRIEIADTAHITFEALAADVISIAAVESGDQQSRNVGTVLPKPLRVYVADQFDNPIPNHPIDWTITQGGTGAQLIDGTRTYTDINGFASNRYRLGEEASIQYNRIEASANGLKGSPVRFTQYASNNPPSSLVVVSGSNQQGNPQEQLPNPLVVQLIDAAGNAIWGLNVAFEKMVNSGSIVSSNPVKSDLYGNAQAYVKLGSTSGMNLFKAYLPNYPSIQAVTFTATTNISSTSATRLRLVEGSGQTEVVGRLLSRQLVVATEDEYGNRVGNVPVIFTVLSDANVKGSGTLQGGVKSLSTVSNTSGIASVMYTLGTTSGLNRVSASSPNLTPASVIFDLYGTADVPYTMDIYSGDNQKMQVGHKLLDPVVVLVKDQYGNPAPNGLVYFTILQGGGHIYPDSPIASDQNGLAKAWWQLGQEAIQNKIIVTANFPGVTVPLYFNATGDLQPWPYFVNLPEMIEGNENELVSFLVQGKDDNGDQIYVTARNLPEGAQFTANANQSGGLFAWTPTYEQGGQTYYPSFVVTDAPGGKAIDTVKIVITNASRPPIIDSFTQTPSGADIKWGQSVTFQVDAHDPDGGSIYFKWYVNNSQVAEFGSSFVFDTRYYNMGLHTIRVVVYDSENAQVENEWLIGITSVELSSFSCTATAYDGARIVWETASEVGNLGFNILRGLSEDGVYEQINSEQIPSSSERRYVYVDKQALGGVRFYYKLQDISVSGQKTLHGPVVAEIPLPETYELSQNYPNPFNPITSIRFQLPDAGEVKLEVFNLNGQLVRVLVDDYRDAGYHAVVWDARDAKGIPVGSGLYYYRILASDFTLTKKMVLLK